MTELLLETTRNGDQTRIAVNGALHGPAARAVQHDLRHVIDTATSPRLVVDLRNCTDIDTHGVLVLVTASHAASSRGRLLTLAAVPPLIRHRLEQHPQTHNLLPTDP